MRSGIRMLILLRGLRVSAVSLCLPRKELRFNIRRPALLCVLCASVVNLCVPLPAAQPSERPNILFIRTDDQARWAVGAYGNDEIHTPNMDRICREGAMMNWAFVTTPVCSPSRVALMSGLRGIQAGVTEWIRPDDLTRGLNPEYVTWPEALMAADYTTGYIGKWHMGTAPRFHPTNNGFRYFMGIPTGGTRPLGPDLEIHGVQRKLEGVYLTDFLTDDALHFIRQNRDVPFLLMVEYRAPHSPYAPVPEQDAARYEGADVTIPDFPDIDRERCRQLTLEYYASITSVDRNIGRMLDLLDELGLAENTIVVFTSDHGYMIGHHGLWHKGNAVQFQKEGALRESQPRRDPQRRRPNMFDNSIRVPLAIRWPARIEPGAVVDAFVMQTDLYATLLSLAGVEMPALPAIQPIESHDFSPALLGGEYAGPATIFGDYDMSTGKAARMRMVRTREWKLVQHREEAGAEDELYDLVNDPGELENLFDDPPDGAPLEELLDQLSAWQRSIDDPLQPIRN